MRGDGGTFVESIDFDASKSSSSQNVKYGTPQWHRMRERENAITSTVSPGDQIVAINGHDVSTMALDDIEALIENPPSALTADNLNVLQLPDNELSVSSSANYSESGNVSNVSELGDDGMEPKKRKLKKRSTKSRLMKLMKLSKEEDDGQSEFKGPICVTFRRVVLCPYFSPLILYREIKKAIQNHALSLAASSDGDDHKESESKSYRKQKANLDKLDVQKWL